MSDYLGTFIVLEGVDGSGKTTQFKLLAERLKAVGYDVETYKFPQYDNESSYFVRKYLNGDYGPANQISPYSASLFYALDRFEAAPVIRRDLETGKVVLADRYVGANMAHQGSKFTNEAEQRGFFIWADSLEFQLLGLPRPSINLFLRLPAEMSFELMEERETRSYTNKKRDEHEADIEHLRNAVGAYDNLCRLFPRDFQAIECVQDGQIMSIADVNDLIWQVVRPLLPPEPQHPARASVVKLDGSTPKVSTKKPSSSKEVKKNPKNPVEDQEKQKNKVSLLALIGELKQGGTARDLSFGGEAGYYIPEGLSGKFLAKYQQSMDQLFKWHNHIRQTLLKSPSGSGPGAAADTIAHLVLPLAAYAKFQPSPNSASALGFVEIDKQQSSQTAIDGIARQRLSANLSTELEPLTLVEAWPRNEFDILSDNLYGLSDLPRQQVQLELASWTYDQKHQALVEILKKPSANSQQPRYRWDVIAEQALLLKLLKAGLAANLQPQDPTVRYGYEIPTLIEKAGLENEFISSFDLSLELFSDLQTSNEHLAPYATLLGHKIRFQFAANLGTLAELDKAGNPALRAFRDRLVASVAEHHPLVGAHLKPTTRNSRRRRTRRRQVK